MRTLVCFSIMLAMAGCGKPVATVTGKVTLDGKSLEIGEIGFHPPGGGPVATTRISTGGTYSVGADAAIIPGSYKVVIIANEVKESKGPGAVLMPKRITPEVYGKKESTPLNADLKSGSNTVNFDLKNN